MKANEAFNAIKAFSIQASKTTRGAIQDGIVVGKQVVNDRALLRQMAIKGGIGAGIGAAAGVGTSYATGDRHAARDGIMGGVAGGLLGAGWAGRGFRPGGPATSAASRFTETNMVHGPSAIFERDEQSGGLRSGWEKAESAAGDGRAFRNARATESMSGVGSPRVRAGSLDRNSSYGYSALPNRYKLPRDR